MTKASVRSGKRNNALYNRGIIWYNPCNADLFRVKLKGGT